MACLPSQILVRSNNSLVVNKSENIASYSSILLSLGDPGDTWVVVLCPGEIQMDPLPLERTDLLAVLPHPGFETISLADLLCHHCHLDRVVQRSRKAHQVSISHGPPWARFPWVVVQRREVHPSERNGILMQLKV
jgi:hypothetical protein